MTICIIPARANSKRIKNKNILNFYGKPLISYAIDIAKKSKLFSRIVVSTDSIKIAKIAEKYGAEVPFLRSKKLSNDYSTSTEAVIDCIKKISTVNEKYHWCIYPTTLFVTKNDLRSAFQKMKKTNSDFLISATDFDSSPHRALKIIKKNRIDFNSYQYAYSRSQDLPKLLHDCGLFYIYKTSSLLKKRKKLPKKTTFFYIDRLRSLDINDSVDIELARMRFRYLKKIK
jgi:pseudaminic acid cytidylyltransferase